MERHSNPQPKRTPHSTFIGILFSIIINLILLALLSWVLLTIWVVIKYFILKDSSIHDQIRVILNYDLSEVANYYPSVCKYLISIFQHIHINIKKIINFFVDLAVNEKMFYVFIESTEIILVRACLFFLAMPFFIVIYFISIVDGLAQRDIRKYRAERESTFFFHRVKSLSSSCLFILFFVYMVIPLPVGPIWLLFPIIFLYSFFTMLSVKYYKKYI